MASDAVPARYTYEWRAFADWCAAFGHTALPAEPLTVAHYLMDDNHEVSPRTLRSRVAQSTRLMCCSTTRRPVRRPRCGACYLSAIGKQTAR